MGLLERFLNNGSALDIETPSVGGGPINDPTSGFVQNYLPNSTYENATLGQPDNGSELANTLNQTNLDTDSVSNSNVSNPINVDIPLTPSHPLSKGVAMGEFYGKPSKFTQEWSIDNMYLDKIDYKDGNAQIQSLKNTGLDNTNKNVASTAEYLSPIIPDNTPYPPEATGRNKYFKQEWAPTNGYFDYYKGNKVRFNASQKTKGNFSLGSNAASFIRKIVGTIS